MSRLAKKASIAGITMVATASAALLDDSDHPKDICPTELVPTPQKKNAGAASRALIDVFL